MEKPFENCNTVTSVTDSVNFFSTRHETFPILFVDRTPDVVPLQCDSKPQKFAR